MKKFLSFFSLVSLFTAFSVNAVDPDVLLKRINSLPDKAASPEERKVISGVLQDILQTPTGKKIILAAQDNLTFTVRFIPELGTAQSTGIITLGKARMDWMNRTPDERMYRVHCCALAEVMVHEAVHSLQFAKHYTRLPRTASFMDAVILQMFVELQARIISEKARLEMENLPESRKWRITAADTVFLELTLRGFKNPTNAYYQLFWNNQRVVDGKQMSIKTIKRCEGWTSVYQQTAFQREYPRLLVPQQQTTGSPELKQILQEAMSWDDSSLSPDFFLKPSFVTENNSVFQIRNGKRCSEWIALPCGYAVMNLSPYGEVLSFQLMRFHGSDCNSANRTELTPDGTFKQWTPDGKLRLSIPVVNNRAEGIGTILENGRTVRKRFKNGAAAERL